MRDPVVVKFRPIMNQILAVNEVKQKIDIKETALAIITIF